MPYRQNLLDDITAALGPALQPSLTDQSAADDLYEAYLFCLVIRAARAEGATVNYKCIAGGAPNPFVFRTSPGYIGSRQKNYAYAEIIFDNCPVLEVHVGVRVAGQSNVLHECDVCVLLQEEAETCRRGPLQIAPRSSKLIIAVEAKYYAGDIPLYLGRAFLGLQRDLSTGSVYFVANKSAASVEKLLAHKRQLWEHDVKPSSQVPIDRLRNSFQTAFKDFRARMR
jgi:hypothetical protein